MKFRVLRGSHSEGSYPKDHPWAGKPIVYVAGEIVDSTTNLAKFNAQGPLGPKFQRIYDNTQATDKVQQGFKQAQHEEAIRNADDGNGPGAPIQPQLPSDGLDEMSLQDLRKLAKEEGVALPSNSTKEEAIAAIRGAPVTT
jgi:hypothetical protein